MKYDGRLLGYQISAAMGGEDADKPVSELLDRRIWLVIEMDVRSGLGKNSISNHCWPETEERFTFAEAAETLNALLLEIQGNKETDDGTR